MAGHLLTSYSRHALLNRLAAPLLAILLTAGPAQAAECTVPNGRVIASQSSGPQAITVVAQPEDPVVGPVRMVVVVCDPMGQTPVEKATVTLTPTNPSGVTGRPALAFTRGTSGEYSADLSVKQGGNWRYLVRVRSALGETEVDAPVAIRQPEGGDENAGWLFVLVAAALAGGAAYVTWASRRRSREAPMAH